MQCTIMTAAALAGILAFFSGVSASPVQAPAAAVEDRSAWMFKYCSDTDLGGKCAQKTDDGNLQVCVTLLLLAVYNIIDVLELGTLSLEDISALAGEPVKSIKTYDHFDCWTYADSGCKGLATRYLPGTHNNPATFKTWRCYSGSGKDQASA
ncbi:hypothetical protein PG988_007784 [Apiospora saccharicola]